MAPDQKNPQPDPLPVAGAGVRFPVVLLMDDEDSILEPFGKLLEIDGFSVITAHSGEEALAAARAAAGSGNKIDVAVLDLTIPGGMGGMETFRQIVGIDPAVQVIVTSGYLHPENSHDFDIRGFIGFLPKPFTWAELRNEVHKALNARGG